MKEPNFDEIYIVGFRLHYESETPEFYTIIVDEESEAPVTHDGSILFVTDIKKAELIYSYLDRVTKDKFAMPTKMEKGIDVAKALYLLENEERDDASIILDFLNIIFDLLNSIEIIIPNDKREILYGLADYLTFEDDFSTYLDKSSINRLALIDIIIWCVGKLVTRSRVLF